MIYITYMRTKHVIYLFNLIKKIVSQSKIFHKLLKRPSTMMKKAYINKQTVSYMKIAKIKFKLRIE